MATPKRTGQASRRAGVRGLRGGAVLVLLAMTFAYGVGVGVFQLFPYGGLQALYRAALGGSVDPFPHREGHAQLDGELLRLAFTRDLSLPVLREPATRLDDILGFNERIHTPVELFFDAPDHIEIIGAGQLDIADHASVLVVDCLFDGRERRAYAYGALAESYRASVLMIPGSGENKSQRIVSGNQAAYHCCLYDELDGFDRFVQIKPNEGLRAVHDGGGRLHEDFFINWHLYRGSSYSAAYIVEAVALARFLSERSENVAVVGLSQGGIAALLVGLLHPPDALVVASGYSSISAELAEAAGHVQVVIPGVADLLAPEAVLETIAYPSLITFGRAERGLYRLDAETGRTCAEFRSSSHIDCLIHDGGHEYPVPEVLSFLGRLFD